MESFETSCKRLERAGVHCIELHGNHYGVDLGYKAKAKEISKIMADHGSAYLYSYCSAYIRISC